MIGAGGGGAGALLAGNVWLTSVGVIETFFWFKNTNVSPTAARSAATNADAGQTELRPRPLRPPCDPASIDFEADVSSTSLSVRSRSQSGAGMNTGAAPSSETGLTSRRRSSSQTSQDSMCREMRLRISTLK